MLKDEIKQSLQTDSLGRVNLGKLSQVLCIESTVQPKGDICAESHSWTIKPVRAFSYPEHLRVLEGEAIELPYFQTELNKHCLRFIKYVESSNKQSHSILSNELSKVQILTKPNSDQRYLHIADLKEGKY